LAFYQESGTSLHAHNLFIELLECTGIVGTSIFAFFFILILRELISARRHGGKRVKARSALLQSLIASTLAHGITDMPVTGLQTGLFFFLILALRPKLNKNGLQGDIWE
ncbi:MAG: hypothetical protein Q8878_05960, partial [Bacillota bacterium]|nr:hypothetical protein [Bacillota bacterium]